MKKNMQEFFGKFCHDFRNADVQRANQTTSLRCEPLESREMLSATGLGAAALDEVAYVATETNPESEAIDLSAVPDDSSAEYTGLGMVDLGVDWEFLNAAGTSVNVNVFSTCQQYLRDDVVIDFENNTIQYPDGYTDYFEYEDIIVNYDESFKLRHSNTVGAIVDGGCVTYVSQADYYDQDGGYHHSTTSALIRPTDYVYSETAPSLVESVSFEIPEWMDVEKFSYVVVDFNAKANAQTQDVYYTINGDYDNPVPIGGDDAYGRHYGQIASLRSGTNVIEFSEPVYNSFDLRLDLHGYTPELSIQGTELYQTAQVGDEGVFTTTEFAVRVADSDDVGADFSRYEINSLTIRGALVSEEENANAFEITVAQPDLNVTESEVIGSWIIDYADAIPALDLGGEYEIEYVLNYGVKDQDGFYRQGVDKYVPVELTSSASFLVAVPGVVTNEPVWNLDDYSAYKSFKIDATPDANTTTTLYGLEKDGETYTALKSWDFVGPEAVATISGRDFTAENLWITESATKLLAGVKFDGGKALLDKLTLDATDDDDSISIGSETVVTETQVFTTNPYLKTLERYKTLYGEESATYQKIAENLNAAYDRLSKIVTQKSSTWGVVDINGETTKFLGTRDVAINTGAGDDSIQIDALHYNYTVSTEGAADTLNFSEAEGRVNLDLGADYRQYALVGDGGTLKLEGTFVNVVGTPRNDRVVGTDLGLAFVGNGGSDSVTLVGGQNDVSLDGPRQSVVARGNGVYDVVIENGDYSVVNASGVTKKGNVDVSVAGAHATVFAGAGYFGGAVEGDYATINAGAIHESAFGVVGDHAVITTGGGVDIVTLVGDNGSIVVGAGDDIVYVYGTNENIRLGTGNDECVIRDGESGKAGVNYIWGDAGNDVIVAAETTGANYLYAGVGNDVIVGGAGGDYIYANSGDNILIGLGGSDRLYGGSGRDVLIASTSDLLTSDDLTYRETLDALFATWNVEKDVDATIQLLGEHCVADGSKDWLYRGAGRNNLLYASQLDVDVENALERSPFNDVIVLDDPNAADDTEGDE